MEYKWNESQLSASNRQVGLMRWWLIHACRMRVAFYTNGIGRSPINWWLEISLLLPGLLDWYHYFLARTQKGLDFTAQLWTLAIKQWNNKKVRERTIDSKNRAFTWFDSVLMSTGSWESSIADFSWYPSPPYN